MMVKLDKAPAKDSEAENFIDELKKIPSLHFKTIPATTSTAEPPETQTLPTGADDS